MSDTWIILGATSTMARIFARELAAKGDALILAARDKAELDSLAADCMLRGARFADPMHFDARDPKSFGAIVNRASEEDSIVNAATFVGSMPDQAEVDANPALIEGMVADNFTGPAHFLQMLAPILEKRGVGTVVGVSSVAGDRGRLSNYAYGAAKAGFATYMAGLRNRLGRKGVHVLTVKPGPVDTAMTWGLGKLPFMATPEAVIKDILKAVKQRRNVIYSARIWWAIMLIIRAIPEAVFKKTSI